MTALLLAAALAAPPADPPGGEFGKMLAAILAGSKMGPTDGWFGPARKRHDWPWLARLHGVPPDKDISKVWFRGKADLFAGLDRDGNGHLTADDFDWSDGSLYARQMGLVRGLMRQADADDSGAVDAAEWGRLFDKRAANGELSPEQVRRLLFPPAPPAGKPSPFGNPADEPSTLTLLKGLLASEVGSGHPGPAVDSPAPDFTLATPDGRRTVTLSKLVGPKPVVLVFGNFSCGPFRAQYQAVEALKQKYAGRAEFVGVYVREAHPTDGWRMASNDLTGVKVAQPRTLGERAAVATRCSAELKMTLPLLVDTIDDRAGHAYSGMPSRLYLIDRAGAVAYQSGRGPFGFKPGELEQALNLLLLADQVGKPKAEATDGGLSLLSVEDAWKRLPAGEGKVGPLPGWARALAGPLPRTVAAMLELEQAVRVKMPLDPKLRAKVRWAAANAGGSRYGETAALADLKRAGGTAAEVAALAGDGGELPAGERATLRFARKLTNMGSSVTDAEFEAVRKLHGDEAAVGITLVIAYANFQDRLVLSLGTPAADGELPVPAVTFAEPPAGGAAPERVLPSDPPPGPPARMTDPAWLEVGAESLRRSMAAQAERQPRVPVPTFEAVKAKLPPGTLPPGRTIKIRWSLTVMGYQPAVANAWLNCLRTFEAESKQDRRFEESLFWVVTRSVDCFY